jgi:dTDP-4-amino-4,6-dideoxygalactose transaminase
MTNNMTVKFVDIPAQYSDIEGDIIDAMADIIHKGSFVGGPALAAFETKLAQYAGTKFAVGCSDGTVALLLSLLAAGIKKGESVVVPVNTFIATANAVVHAGGVPVFVDCDPDSYLMDPNQAEDIFKTGKVRFVMPVHLYGNPCPMKQIMEIAGKYDVIVIEDNAQALGACVDEHRTGSFGAAAGVSFYPAKNLGAFGQGGAVLTNDEETSKFVRMYVEQGQSSERYYHEVIGYNARLDNIQACILSMLLDRLDDFNVARRRAADQYASRLPADHIQKRTAEAKPVYHLFEYRCDSKTQRDKLAEALKAAGIGFGYHYPVPIHKQKAYAEYNKLSFPVAERLAETLISLPMHPGLTEEQVDSVCNIIANL